MSDSVLGLKEGEEELKLFKNVAYTSNKIVLQCDITVTSQRLLLKISASMPAMFGLIGLLIWRAFPTKEVSIDFKDISLVEQIKKSFHSRTIIVSTNSDESYKFVFKDVTEFLSLLETKGVTVKRVEK